MWTSNRLTLAANNGARCLDGSEPNYYLRPGSSYSSTKWLIFYEGGGWCTTNNAFVSSTFDSCAHRSTGYLGTTKYDVPTISKDDNIFSRDPAINPAMASWNMVYIRYCDGSSFTSDLDTTFVQDGTTLYFRGARIRKAIADDLFANKNLGAATEVVIAGCSAGGLAANIALDWWAAQLPNAWRVTGLLDSSFFLQHESPGCPYVQGLQQLVSIMNSTGALNDGCVSANAGQEYVCMFPQQMDAHVQTDMFALQPKFDPWQLNNQACLMENDVFERNDYGDLALLVFKNTFIWGHTNRGGFVDSCPHHCWKWNELYIGGISNSFAFKDWYDRHWPNQPPSGTDYWIDDQQFQCWSCCSQIPPSTTATPTTGMPTTTTKQPTKVPSRFPSEAPSLGPSDGPSRSPSGFPSQNPTMSPTIFCFTGVFGSGGGASGARPLLGHSSSGSSNVNVSENAGPTRVVVKHSDWENGFGAGIALGVLLALVVFATCYLVVYVKRRCNHRLGSEVLLTDQNARDEQFYGSTAVES